MTLSPSPSRRAAARRVGVSPWALASGGLALAPWGWFAVRDLWVWLDLVAIGLPLIVLVCLGGLLATAGLRRDPRLLVAAASWLAFGAGAILLPFDADPGPAPLRPVRIVAANASSNWEAAPAVVKAVRGAEPDVAVVVEASPTIVDLMAAGFAHDVHAVGFLDRPGSLHNPRSVSVGSRFALERLPDLGLPGVRLRVAAPGRPFVLYALHVPKANPSPRGYSVSFREHRRIVAAVAAASAREELPVVVAGDLNAPDRAGDYRTLRGDLNDAVLSGSAGPTSVKAASVWRALLLRIDHILHSPDWCAAGGDRIVLPGSDHRAVVAEVGPCPAPTPSPAGDDGH